MFAIDTIISRVKYKEVFLIPLMSAEQVLKFKHFTMSNNKGKISQIIGPVIDIVFENENNDLPRIYDALEITKDSGDKMLVECQQHVGENTIRAVAMDSTDGLRRGMDVYTTGNPILMPIGNDIKGRLFNVVGEAIDGIGSVSKEKDPIFNIKCDPLEILNDNSITPFEFFIFI